MTHFGRLISTTRQHAGLTPQQLAVRVGYTNANKGARRIETIESGGGDDAGIVEKILEVLEISTAAAREAVRLDETERRERYLKAISTPVDPALTIRWMPAVYIQHPLPDGVRDPIELESIASEIAREKSKRVHLLLPNRTTLWINADGETYSRSEPDDEGQPAMPGTRISGKPLPGFLTDSLLDDDTSDE